MYPKEFVIKRKALKKHYLYHVIFILISILSFCVLSPLLHEVSHLFVLNGINAKYRAYILSRPLTGVYGLINVYSPMTLTQATIVLTSGIFSSFLLFVTLFFPIQKVRNHFINVVLLSLSLGVYLDFLLNLFQGDIITLFSMFGLSTMASYTIVGFILIPSLFYVFKKTTKFLKSLY